MLSILILIVLFLYYAVCTQLSNYVRVAGGGRFQFVPDPGKQSPMF